MAASRSRPHGTMFCGLRWGTRTQVRAEGLRPRTPGPGRGPRSSEDDWERGVVPSGRNQLAPRAAAEYTVRRTLGCRLTVGRLTLDQKVGVRIPAAQPADPSS